MTPSPSRRPAVAAVCADLEQEIGALEHDGALKSERVLGSPQGPRVRLADGREVVNVAANDYLGFANDPSLIVAAHAALDSWGLGVASVRFIVGTQEIHLELERKLSEILGTEATILHPSAFDANAGLFEPLVSERDVVISDALNHASLIDGIRLCKARRLRYAHADMAELELHLREARTARRRLIVTDGVFSMDGDVARLDQICDLADRYDALVVVDDSHGVGVLGPGGRGTPAHFGVSDRVDVVTGTLGKALGGASGGYVAGRREIVGLLRQRSRPYLFSNSLAPPVVAGALEALELVANSSSEAGRQRLLANAAAFSDRMRNLGFDTPAAQHPIVPVMLGDAAYTRAFADRLLAHGIYAIAFSYPVVPRGAARIRVQLSAGHTDADLELAVAAFVAARGDLASV
jgi:glycine C-acetyltransferase